MGQENSLAERLQRLKNRAQQQPEDPFPLYAIGMELEKCGEWDEAELAWQTLLRQHPGYVPALQRLAGLLFNRNRLAEAQTCVREALRCAEPDSDDHTRQYLHQLLHQIEDELNPESGL